MVTFNDFVKKEILEQEYKKNDLKEIFLTILKISSFLRLSDSNFNLTFTIHNYDLIKFIYTNFNKIFPNKYSVQSNGKKKFYKYEKRVFEIEIFAAENIYQELKNFTIKNLKNFLIGSFLCYGNVNSPESSNYFLSIGINSDELAKEFANFLLKKNDFNFKSRFQGKHIFYLQQAEKIGDFLRYVGTSKSLLTFEDKRIERDYFNSIQRLNNLDVSNLKKTAKESIIINRKIYELKNAKVFTKIFNIEERQILMIKYKNQDFSHQSVAHEYNDKFQKNITRAKVSYILKKLKDTTY